MKLNSPDYLHTVVEALKLAYADRDTYYGDPAFVRTPGEGLLSKAYAKERAKLIDPETRVPRIRRRRPAAVRRQCQGHGTTGSRTSPMSASLHRTAARPGAGLRLQQGHHPHRHHRPRRQHLRFDAERRLDRRRRHPRRHRHRHERPRRAVLARQDARRATAPARTAALHAHALHCAARRRALHGARLAGRRQPGPDHPAGVPRHRRVLARLVSEPARGVRMAARPDAAFLRLVLAAQFGLQQAQCRGEHSRRRLQRPAGARPRCRAGSGRSA